MKGHVGVCMHIIMLLFSSKDVGFSACAYDDVVWPVQIYKHKYNSYFYCAPYSLTDTALLQCRLMTSLPSINLSVIVAYDVIGGQ